MANSHDQKKLCIKSGSPFCGYPEKITFNRYTVSIDGDGEEKESSVFPGHYVIFNLAFEHGVLWDAIKQKKNMQRFSKALGDSGWKLHAYLSGEKTRNFYPNPILTEASKKSLLGSCESMAGQSCEEIIRSRLNPDVGSDCSESLLYTLNHGWISDPFEETISQDTKPLKIEKSYHNSKKLEDHFYLPWVDLWLMADGTGMLSFKVILDDNTSDITIDRSSLFIRTLRDYKDKDIIISDSKGKSAQSFWDTVFNKWLNFGNQQGACHSDLLMTKLLLKTTSKTPYEYVDRFSRYCKTLIAAQMPDLKPEHETHWNQPLSDPPAVMDETPVTGFSTQKGFNLIRQQAAIIAGYATTRDMIPYELATMSEEGKAAGWNEDKAWQYSLEYIRGLIEQNMIEVWEYWAGLALRDSCAFVSFSTSVPIMTQAESRYYPLYVHTYHLRYRLDILSEDIVDYEMSDAFRGRFIQDKFQRFRNHFWFQESTKDFVGVEVFDYMKKGMNLPDLYDAVSLEISEVGQHLQKKWERSMRLLVVVLGVFTWPIKTAWDEWLWPLMKENHSWILNALESHWQIFSMGTIVVFVLGVFVVNTYRKYRLVIKKKRMWQKLLRILSV